MGDESRASIRGRLKDKLAVPFGGRVTTDRDQTYCPCGHLWADHSEAHAKQCACEKVYV